MTETFIPGPRQIGSCRNSETFGPGNERASFIPLKRAARYLVGRPKAALRFRRQKHVDKITVFVDSDFAGDPVSWKSTPGLVAQIGNHGLSSSSMNQDLGIPMKIEIQSDSSMANSLTDRLGAGQRTKKHIDTGNFWMQERVQVGDLSIKKVPTAKNCADVGTKPVSASELRQHCKLAGLVFY